MGNRVKGRVKKKSIKAALSSKAGSKRRLSRMGKKQKKEHAGLEASFIGRSKCLKMLQITLKDFRRLCILKGIYPREPLGRVPGNKKGQTFYHIKDIRAIAHEPILDKFRGFRAFMKKVRRAAGRNEPDEAQRRHAVVPTYSLHHLVKERYPRFVDAISDVDDALTLSYLFAALPGDGDIKPSVVTSAKSLVAAWGAYCATTASITKAFISVKGVYLEADIEGTPVRWIVPHTFTQYLPEEVDYKVMGTFMEFYTVLLKFVLYKLYNSLGVRYPLPTSSEKVGSIGSTSSILSANLRQLKNALNASDGAVSSAVSAAVEERVERDDVVKKKDKPKKPDRTANSVAAALKSLNDHDESSDEDLVDVVSPLEKALDLLSDELDVVPGGVNMLNDDSMKRRRLFAGLTFFLSREIPRGYLELICLSFGAKIGWEGDDSPISMKDPSITHHVVDRPKLPANYETLPKSREFVQPQFIVDCANFLMLLPVSKYAFGVTLPPHLSPWVDDEEEGYKPAYAEEIERLKNGDVAEAADVNEKNEKPALSAPPRKEKTPDVALSDGDDNNSESSESDDEENVDSDKARERKEKLRVKEEQEAHVLAKSMMARKAAHLYGRMMHGIARKQAKVDELHRKRQEIDSGKEKNDSGKSAQKQKVERLKKERRSIEVAYDNVDGSMKRKKSKKS